MNRYLLVKSVLKRVKPGGVYQGGARFPNVGMRRKDDFL
jgi:hypothetical protein